MQKYALSQEEAFSTTFLNGPILAKEIVKTQNPLHMVLYPPPVQQLKVCSGGQNDHCMTTDHCIPLHTSAVHFVQFCTDPVSTEPPTGFIPNEVRKLITNRPGDNLSPGSGVQWSRGFSLSRISSNRRAEFLRQCALEEVGRPKCGRRTATIAIWPERVIACLGMISRPERKKGETRKMPCGTPMVPLA